MLDEDNNIHLFFCNFLHPIIKAVLLYLRLYHYIKLRHFFSPTVLEKRSMLGTIIIYSNAIFFFQYYIHDYYGQ